MFCGLRLWLYCGGKNGYRGYRPGVERMQKPSLSALRNDPIGPLTVSLWLIEAYGTKSVSYKPSLRAVPLPKREKGAQRPLFRAHCGAAVVMDMSR